MQAALPGFMLALLLVGMSSAAHACEKHLNGHQNGTNTNIEGSFK